MSTTTPAPTGTSPGAAPEGAARRVRLPRPGHARGRIVTTVLLVVTGVLAVVGLGLGDLPLNPLEVVSAAFAGPDGGFATTVVLEWRAPRVVAALAYGAALGIAGALFQTLTRNPLGSPDVIGFTTGAYTGVLIGMTLLPGAYLSRSGYALAGGLLTALVVYVLAYRRGVQGFRLIIVGIGITAMLQAFNTWMLVRAQTEVAMSASIWAAGSLGLESWDDVVLPLVLLLVLLPAVVALAPPLRQLETGDDGARARGVRVEPTRLAVMIVAVALTAAVTASAGPIAFVALAAPQIAHRLTRGAGLPLVGSAITGAFLLLGADIIAQHLLPRTVPVGMVTVVLGGVYLIALLVHGARRRT